MRKCDVCGHGFTKSEWEEHHSPHEPDCWNFINYGLNPDGEISGEPCDCDLVTHEKCCPQCHTLTDNK